MRSTDCCDVKGTAWCSGLADGKMCACLHSTACICTLICSSKLDCEISDLAGLHPALLAWHEILRSMLVLSMLSP